MLCFCIPNATSRFIQAIAAAPAPETTIRTSEIFFLNYSQAIKNGGSTDDRRSVLVVMEDRDIHALTQFLFNIETFGRFNIFEVNAAEGRLQRRDHVDKFIRVKLIDFYVKYIDAGEFF